MEDMIEEVAAWSGSTDHLERVIWESSSKEDMNQDQETEGILEQLNSPQESDTTKQTLDQTEKLEENTPELKELPSHLKYVFLGGDRRHPAIISNTLTKLQEEQLSEVFTEHKKDLGRSIGDCRVIFRRSSYFY
jgi:hypothetical protein